MSGELRPYQKEAIEQLRLALSEKLKPVLSAPTGSGKTRIASEIFALARSKNKRVCFVVPFISLINQTWKAFVNAGIDEREMSVIQGNHILTDYSMPVQIASIDTLARRKKLPEADIIIFDECHKKSVVHTRWMLESPNSTFIGLSATPWAKGMGAIWDKMIIVSTPKKLIDEGYLSNFRYFAPSSPDLSEVKIIAGDYQTDQLASAMNKPELVADVVTTWMKRGEDRPTFCFAVDCSHARALQSQFIQAGIPAAYIDAETPVKEREDLVDKLRYGEIKIICNVGTMTTGVDAPFVSCLIIARPTKSEMLYVQIVGRGLRKCEGKADCLILDHSDNGIRMGLPDQIEYFDFSDKPAEEKRVAERKKRERKLTPCPSCQFLKLPKENECPSCGFAPKHSSNVIYIDGDLVEHGRNGKIALSTRAEKQEFWSGLLYYAKERNYQRGWCSHKYKEKFGVWPQGLVDYETYPTQTVLNFIKSRNIAWAKKKNKREKIRAFGNLMEIR